jgi:hypothetical protein
MAVPAQATVYFLDLSTAGADIAAWGDMPTLVGGLELSFDNHGSPYSLDSAVVDSYGINGSTEGDLIIKFPYSIYGLKFDFTVGGITDPGTQLASAVTAVFYNVIDGTFGDFVGDPVTQDGTYAAPPDEGPGNSVGTFQWNSYLPADYAVLTFAPYLSNLTTEDLPVYTVNSFNVSNLYYGDTSGDLPEPSTWAMMLGGVALVGLGRARRHKASI